MFRQSAFGRAAVGLAACGWLLCEDAFAQAVTPETTGEAAPLVDRGAVSAYPPAFFADFRPSNAFEMVERLPGFSFNGGADVRGFGGAAGNVLIDGERPSSKSVDLRTTLQRIPAAQVERIDVVRGGAPGIDMQGQSVVANVIRKKGAASSLATQLLLKHFNDGFTSVIPRVEGSWRSGPLSVEGQLGYRNDRTDASGEGPFRRRTAAGATLQEGRFSADQRQELTNFNVAAEYRPGADTLRMNMSGAHEIERVHERSMLRDATGDFQVLNNGREDDWDWEVGGDYERPLGEALTGRVIALATFATEDAERTNRGRGPLQESLESAEGGERILRGVLTATPTAAWRLEGGAEAAFNYLDKQSVLREGGVTVPLPSDNVRVEERRAEAFATANWQYSPELTFEGGLRYERSTISQTGGVDQEKTLSFAKPRLIVSWAPDGASQLRLRIEREVGQLDFSDFAASAELDTGSHNAGNRDLEPERAWVVETAVERRFWSKGAVVLTLNHAAIESAVDLIPIDNRYDAPGNIGDGWRQSARVDLTLPFDRLGLTGGLLKANATWRRSEVTDPVTGRVRSISGDRPFEGYFLFSQSVPSLHGIFSIETVMNNRNETYRINELREVSNTSLVKLIWDWTPRPDTMVRFQIENATAKTTVRERTIYAGPRSAGVVSVFERREARFDPFLMMRVRRTF